MRPPPSPARAPGLCLQLLFLYFGYKMIKEGLESQGGPSEELTEVIVLFLLIL